MVMGSDGAQNQERLCWLGPAVIYGTGLAERARRQTDQSESEVIVRQWPHREGVGAEVEEPTMLRAVARQRIVKTETTVREKVNCRLRELARAL
jgi:hypothetical protein